MPRRAKRKAAGPGKPAASGSRRPGRKSEGPGKAPEGKPRLLYRLARALLYLLLLVSPLLGWAAIEASRLPDVESLRSENPAQTAMMRFRAASALRDGNGEPRVFQFWVSMDEIAPVLREAVMASEDDRFFDHQGFDFAEMEKSARLNLSLGMPVRGGSTITQQLAKNLYLSPEKSIVRKLREALITVALERNLDKSRIYEIYLNVIELGDGVFGVDAACRFYFRKPASRIEPHEAALLATAVPSPLRRNPAEPSRTHRKLAEKLLYRLKVKGVLSADACAREIRELGEAPMSRED